MSPCGPIFRDAEAGGRLSPRVPTVNSVCGGRGLILIAGPPRADFCTAYTLDGTLFSQIGEFGKDDGITGLALRMVERPGIFQAYGQRGGALRFRGGHWESIGVFDTSELGLNAADAPQTATFAIEAGA